MFLGQVNTTSVVGTIPITTVKNTNTKISNNNGVLSLNRAGLWNVDCALTVGGVAGVVTVSVLADGVVSSSVAVTSTSTGLNALPIVDAIQTVYDTYPNVANISLSCDTAGVSIVGRVRVEYVQ